MLKKILIMTAVIGATLTTSVFIYYNPVSAQCPVANRRGCCSHHGGVCGCSHNRALCCDGTLSPSCGCD